LFVFQLVQDRVVLSSDARFTGGRLRQEKHP